ncbi:MAG: hypothetical protein ABIF19_16990 [Planctomycetota bacterium]
MNTIIGLLCLMTVAVLAIYWTVWKIRAELNQNLGNMASELGEIRKSLEKKAGGA